jgi:hypothetical protein
VDCDREGTERADNQPATEIESSERRNFPILGRILSNMARYESSVAFKSEDRGSRKCAFRRKSRCCISPYRGSASSRHVPLSFHIPHSTFCSVLLPRLRDTNANGFMHAGSSTANTFVFLLLKPLQHRRNSPSGPSSERIMKR